MKLYQKAFGFTKRGMMTGPDGKPIHAELTLRGTTLMLEQKTPRLVGVALRPLAPRQQGLFIYTENVDKVVGKAVGSSSNPRAK